jgi:hypothetical protein
MCSHALRGSFPIALLLPLAGSRFLASGLSCGVVNRPYMIKCTAENPSMQTKVWYKYSMTEPTQKRPRGRPATGQTPTRSIRIGQKWEIAAEIAAARGESMTTVIDRLLDHYIHRHSGIVGIHRRT